MSEKKKLPRVSSRVPSAFKQRVEDVKTVLRRRNRWFYNGEKLSEEGLVAAAMLEFMEMDDDGRAAVLDRRIPAIEAMFEEERKATQATEGQASIKTVQLGRSPKGRKKKQA